MRDAIGLEITKAAPGLLMGKAQGGWSAMVVLAILAGAFIGFGSILFLVVQGVTGSASGPVQLLSGVGFSVGLVLTMVTGAELFTGNVLFVLPWSQGRLPIGRMTAAWIVVWLGNLVGSLAIALLFTGAGGGAGADGLIGRAAIEIATTKVDKSAVALLCSGALANMLVCLAVWMAMAARSVPSKVLAIVGPVTVFVAAGFEHSVANQSILPIGWLLQTGDSIQPLAIARNLALSTIGNIVGGVAVALAFGHAHRDM